MQPATAELPTDYLETRPCDATSEPPAVTAELQAGLAPLDTFARRHLGPDATETAQMLDLVGYASLDALIDAAVPAAIRRTEGLRLPAALTESEALAELRGLARQNKVYRNFIGQGYYGTIVPPVIQRNILENPGWYTAYTPYQAEIAQGRMEMLLNFQTMVTDLTGLDIANASLLDEATAAAEAMHLCHAVANPAGTADRRHVFFVSSACHAQTIALVRTRALPLGLEVVVGDH
ncbi:MAG: glycine dehydrogenase (aminomethyl-transferring), partial [Verrucomicrobia bacterium]|nr:glycine dehydrogenase (aminomethyl-transferring) [Verrucomicrobiota bacterium]